MQKSFYSRALAFLLRLVVCLGSATYEGSTGVLQLPRSPQRGQSSMRGSAYLSDRAAVASVQAALR